MRRILVLRPEPGATATVERARALGLEAESVPLFEVEPVAWGTPDSRNFDALLLTSANAVRYGGTQLEALRALPVYAVGQATAQAAREAGFAIAAAGDRGVDELLRAIGPGRSLLHLCGEHRTAAQADDHQVTAVPVYRARELERPDLDDPSGCVALIHSPRAGGRFAELTEHGGFDRSSIAIAAISAAAAHAAGPGWQEVAWPDTPNDDALLALAALLCNNRART